jgi:hypothetical protein
MAVLVPEVQRPKVFVAGLDTLLRRVSEVLSPPVRKLAANIN